jgi:hypothetical protein
MSLTNFMGIPNSIRMLYEVYIIYSIYIHVINIHQKLICPTLFQAHLVSQDLSSGMFYSISLF